MKPLEVEIRNLLTELVVEAQREAQGGKSDTSVGLTTTAILAAVARDRQALLDKVEGLVGEAEPEPQTPEGVYPKTQRDFFVHGRNSLRTEVVEGLQKLREGE